MTLINEINKKLIVNLIVLIVFSGIIFYFYGYSKTGLLYKIPQNYLKILEYVLCAIAILQLFTIYNVIKKVLFNDTILKQLSRSLKENNDKILQHISPEEAVIYNGVRLIFDQNFLLVIYGFSLAFFGADVITFSSFLLLSLLVLCVSWFYLKFKIAKFFSES